MGKPRKKSDGRRFHGLNKPDGYGVTPLPKKDYTPNAVFHKKRLIRVERLNMGDIIKAVNDNERISIMVDYDELDDRLRIDKEGTTSDLREKPSSTDKTHTTITESMTTIPLKTASKKSTPEWSVSSTVTVPKHKPSVSSDFIPVTETPFMPRVMDLDESSDALESTEITESISLRLPSTVSTISAPKIKKIGRVSITETPIDIKSLTTTESKKISSSDSSMKTQPSIPIEKFLKDEEINIILLRDKDKSPIDRSTKYTSSEDESLRSSSRPKSITFDETVITIPYSVESDLTEEMSGPAGTITGSSAKSTTEYKLSTASGSPSVSTSSPSKLTKISEGSISEPLSKTSVTIIGSPTEIKSESKLLTVPGSPSVSTSSPSKLTKISEGSLSEPLSETSVTIIRSPTATVTESEISTILGSPLSETGKIPKAIVFDDKVQIIPFDGDEEISETIVTDTEYDKTAKLYGAPPGSTTFASSSRLETESLTDRVTKSQLSASSGSPLLSTKSPSKASTTISDSKLTIPSSTKLVTESKLTIPSRTPSTKISEVKVSTSPSTLKSSRTITESKLSIPSEITKIFEVPKSSKTPPSKSKSIKTITESILTIPSGISSSVPSKWTKTSEYIVPSPKSPTSKPSTQITEFKLTFPSADIPSISSSAPAVSTKSKSSKWSSESPIIIESLITLSSAESARVTELSTEVYDKPHSRPKKFISGKQLKYSMDKEVDSSDRKFTGINKDLYSQILESKLKYSGNVIFQTKNETSVKRNINGMMEKNVRRGDRISIK